MCTYNDVLLHAKTRLKDRAIRQRVGKLVRAGRLFVLDRQKIPGFSRPKNLYSAFDPMIKNRLPIFSVHFGRELLVYEEIYSNQ